MINLTVAESFSDFPLFFAYDPNGNMATNEREGLGYGYNFLNLLGDVKSGSTVKATYRWLADGTKAGVKTPAGTAGYEYLGSLIYTRNSTGGLDLESAGFGGGRVEVSKDIDDNKVYAASYHLTDHLGSVRVAFKDKNTVSARNDFYPFGKPHVNSFMPLADDKRNRWLYNGKEKLITGDVNFLDYGARPYDWEINRWFNLDPLAREYYRWSPYNYTLNNPVKYVDTDGRAPFWPIGGSGIVNGYKLATDKEYRQAYWQNLKRAATFTDLNDVYVLGSAIVGAFNGSDALHIDGTPATGEDIEAAKMGLFMPTVSGSAVKKAADAVEGIMDAGLQGGRRLPDSKIKEAPAKRGNAPVGDDGKPVELHHRNQTPDGPIDEMTRTDHRTGDNYKINHSNTGQEESLIDRNEFNKQREEYWKREWDSGRFFNQ